MIVTVIEMLVSLTKRFVFFTHTFLVKCRNDWQSVIIILALLINLFRDIYLIIETRKKFEERQNQLYYY